MDNKDYRNNNQYETNESKAKTIWRNIGIGVLSLFVALLTVVVINI